MKEGDDFKDLFDELISADEQFDGAVESIEKVFRYKGRTIRLSISFDEEDIN